MIHLRFSENKEKNNFVKLSYVYYVYINIHKRLTKHGCKKRFYNKTYSKT